MVTAPAALGLATATEVFLFPGGSNRLPVRLERQYNDEPVRLSFAGDANGLILPREVIVNGNKSEAEIEVAALPKAAGGTRTIELVAEGKHGKVVAPCQFTVQVPPAALHLAAPKTLAVIAGGVNRIPIQIAREWFEGPVAVRAITPGGVTIAETTIPADSDGAELEVSADPKAPTNTFQATLTAVSVSAKANATVSLEILPRRSTWSWFMVFVMGIWTALLAMGLSLALVMGQNFYLARPWLSGVQAAFALAGGALAGMVAGAIGQTLFSLLAHAGVRPEIGFLAGWLLLGGLVGRGIAFFIPNLSAWRSCVAGVVGGLIGAAAFILVSQVGVWPGRFVGTALLGACIGLMVAVVELAFRMAWLEVRYGREAITVNLGPVPVIVGGDSAVCTIWRAAPRRLPTASGSARGRCCARTLSPTTRSKYPRARGTPPERWS